MKKFPIIFLLLCGIANAQTFTVNQLQGTSTVDSTTSSSGAAVFAGGVGVGKSAVIGGNITATNGTFTGLSAVTGAAGTNRQNQYLTSGITRWVMGSDSSSETGSNSGSNFNISRFSDSGTVLSSPFLINRATGAVSLQGTVLGDNAITGYVGEYLTGTASAVPLTTGVAATCASVTVSAGDWDVQGQVTFNPAGTTTMSGYNVGVSTVVGTLPANSNTSQNLTMTTGLGQILATPSVRVNVTTSTTVYLSAALNFAVSSASCNGFIHARRMR